MEGSLYTRCLTGHCCCLTIKCSTEELCLLLDRIQSPRLDQLPVVITTLTNFRTGDYILEIDGSLYTEWSQSDLEVTDGEHCIVVIRKFPHPEEYQQSCVPGFTPHDSHYQKSHQFDINRNVTEPPFCLESIQSSALLRRIQVLNKLLQEKNDKIVMLESSPAYSTSEQMTETREKEQKELLPIKQTKTEQRKQQIKVAKQKSITREEAAKILSNLDEILNNNDPSDDEEEEQWC